MHTYNHLNKTKVEYLESKFMYVELVYKIDTIVMHLRIGRIWD